jgi:RNA 2',3'-cyclic 3'-phosphodiesterase
MRRAAAQTAARIRTQAPGRYADPVLFHITLAFLGEHSADALPLIHSAMEAAARGQPPVVITSGKLGFFGDRANAILWFGLGGENAMGLLNLRLRQALISRGISPGDERFRPHITLARQADLRGADSSFSLPCVSFVADALTLFHSCRVNGVLAYTPVARVPFGG